MQGVNTIRRNDLEALAETYGITFETMSYWLVEMSEYFQRMSYVLSEFNLQMYIVAEVTYLQYHKRLPGSNRTTRLRKKRRNSVLNWYAAFLEGCLSYE